MEIAKNQKHLEVLITVIERAKATNKKLNMSRWQSYRINGVEKTEHECKTACCMAGRLAISPEFNALGGVCDDYGSPIYLEDRGELAISNFIGVGLKTSRSLCGVTLTNYSNFYGKYVTEITYDDILGKLYKFRTTVAETI